MVTPLCMHGGAAGPWACIASTMQGHTQEEDLGCRVVQPALGQHGSSHQRLSLGLVAARAELV